MAQLRKTNPRQHSETQIEDIRAHYPDFSRLLIQRKNELLDQENETRMNLDEQVMTAPGDVADVSVIDTSADYFLRLSNNHQRELIEIRDAFDRMNRGVYGVCQSCENPIASERLKMLPYARLCIDCQSAREKGSATAFPRSRPKL